MPTWDDATVAGASGSGPGSGGVAPTPLRRLGKYLVIAELGRGGMGAVYRAQDTVLRREVALKLVDPTRADPQFLQRFAAEGRTGAALRHPGIVAVYEAGAIEGQPFLAMELVQGRSFEALLRETRVPPRRAAEVVRDVARALQHAHDSGVIHRDVKPENMLIDAEGRVRLTDFGIARQVEGADRLTVTGQIMGTPAYMAPEQADGDPHRQGPRTDVYQLGAVLYRALCGRPPFEAGSLAELLKKILMDEPLRLRRVSSKVHIDLETIAARCLEKEPERRYTGAGEVADELQRWLDGEPIEARPAGPLARARRWVARNPLLALAKGGLALAAVVVIGLGVGLARVNAERAAADAREAERGRVDERRAAEERARERLAAFRAEFEQEADATALLAKVQAELARPDEDVVRHLADLRLGGDERRALLLERRLTARQRLADEDALGTRTAAGLALLEGARADAGELLRLDPARSGRWLFVEAMALHAAGPERGEEPLRAALERCRDHGPGPHGEVARALLDAGREPPRDVIARIRGALADPARSDDLAVFAARWLAHCGLLVEAHAVLVGLQAAADARPRLAVLDRLVPLLERLIEAEGLMKLGNLPAATEVARQAAELAPAHELVVRTQLVLFAGQRMFDAVLALAEKVPEVVRDDQESRLCVANAFLATRQPAAALPWIEICTRRDPQDYRGPLLLSRVLFETRRYDEALAAIRRALELQEPDTGELVLRHGQALAALARFDEALAECARAIELGGAGSEVGQQAAKLVRAIRARASR